MFIFVSRMCLNERRLAETALMRKHPFLCLKLPLKGPDEYITTDVTKMVHSRRRGPFPGGNNFRNYTKLFVQ